MIFLRRLWILLFGILYFIIFTAIGSLCALTIFGIPQARIWFEFARLGAYPFEKEIDIDFSSHKFANALWLSTLGWLLVIIHYLLGIVFCASLIFIPFGVQFFKLGKYLVAPYGADVS